MTRGLDTYVRTGDDRPKDITFDTAILADDTTWLMKFASPPSQQTCASSLLTVYPTAAVASGMSLSLQSIADDWQLSQVTAATAPAVAGSAAVTGALGALAAGDPVTFDITAIRQAQSNGTIPDLGLAVSRLDAGADAIVGAFSNALYAPVLVESWVEEPPQPTRLSPSGGRAVSVSQPILRVLDYTSQLAEIALAAMRVQWSATSSFAGTLLADDTQTVTTPNFDMSKTRRTVTDGHITNGSPTFTSATAAFTPADTGRLITAASGIPIGTTMTYVNATTVTMSQNATSTSTTLTTYFGYNYTLTGTAAYWRTQLQTTDGVWSDWSDPVSARYVALPPLTIADPSTATDPDPLRSWTFGGTQTAYSLERVPVAVPSLVLNPLTADKTDSTTQAAYAGYAVKDYSSYTDTVRTWDAVDREEIPGAPAYATATLTWSLVDSLGVTAPPAPTLSLVGATSSYVIVEWTYPPIAVDFFRVRAQWTNGSGINVSGELQPETVLVESTGEGPDTYRWIWWDAPPNDLIDVRIQAVTAHRGSAAGDSASILTAVEGTWFADPILQEWALLVNDEQGAWVRSEPRTAAFTPVEGGNWRIQRGPQTAMATTISGDITATEGRPAVSYMRSLNRMAVSGNDLILSTPHEVVPVQFVNKGAPPLNRRDLGRRISFDVYQTQDSSLTGNDFASGGQGELVILDFEEGVDGDDYEANETVTAVPGGVVYSAAAKMRGNLGLLLPGQTGGAALTVKINPLGGVVVVQSPQGTPWAHPAPGTAHPANIWKLRNGGTTIVQTILETSGKFHIEDGAGTTLDVTPGSVKAATADTAWRTINAWTWTAGILHYECHVYVGSNVYGITPDSILSADISAILAPDDSGFVGHTANSGMDMLIDDLEVQNNAGSLPPPLGAPEFTHLWSKSAAPTTSGFVVTAAVVGADQLQVAWSTTADGAGYPASPTLQGLSLPIFGEQQYGFTISGAPANSAIYYCLATSVGQFVGRPCVGYTSPAAGTAYSELGHIYSCQAPGPDTSTEAWDLMNAAAAKFYSPGGDDTYHGGQVDPADPHFDGDGGIQDRINIFTGQLLSIPPMRTYLETHTEVGRNDSDHEVTSNGDEGTAHAAAQNYALGNMATMWPSAQKRLQTFPILHGIPLLDVRPTPTSTYHVSQRGDFLFHGLDFRNLDRTPGHWDDPLDGSKTAYGAHQLSLLAANLQLHKVNVLCFESWPISAPVTSAIGDEDEDKPWAYSYEFYTTLAGIIAGYPGFFIAGDRHAAAYIRYNKAGNTLGISGLMASATSMHDLSQRPGEVSTASYGYKPYSGSPNVTNRLFGKLTISGDGAGHATIVSDAINAVTGTSCIGGPYTDTFTL